jgi:hypothetical protein
VEIGVTATRREAAREARRDVEDALGPDVRSWRWSLGASRLLDLWIVLEERGQ